MIVTVAITKLVMFLASVTEAYMPVRSPKSIARHNSRHFSPMLSWIAVRFALVNSHLYTNHSTSPD